MFKSKYITYHIIAITVVLIWGGTFVNTKVLLLKGMRAEEIFAARFLMAYACIWLISPRQLWSNNWKDELQMLLLGISGGSMYFLAENIAVGLSYTNNVAFIVCTAPLITTLIAIALIKEVKATKPLIIGSLIALMGTATIIFNGQFILKLNPLGDLLALAASVCWAIYHLIIRNVSGRYGAVLITRKVFGYGLLTILPLFAVHPWSFPLEGFRNPVIWGNLLFLGFIASFSCFVIWSWVIAKIGAISTSNYVYLNPISTVVVSYLVLSEPMTWISALGSALVLLGVFLANHHLGNK